MATKPKLNLAAFSGIVANATGNQTKPADAEVDLTLIDVERQVRTDIGSLAELVTSIKEMGVLEPILLLGTDDGRYRLIAGERRFRSATLAGLSKMPAIIKHGLTDFEIRQIQVTENNEREDLSPFDEAMGVSEDVANFGFKEALRIWNRSESWISKRVAVPKYCEEVLNLLKSGLCGDLEVLHSLNQLHDANVEEFSHMERRLNEGLSLSREEARNKVANVKNFKKQEATFAKRRIEVQAMAKQKKTPAWLQEQRERDAAKQASNHQKSAPSSTAGITPSDETHLSAITPSIENTAKIEHDRLENELKSLREEIFDWGDVNLSQFNSMQKKLAELGHDMNETEFVLWSGFLSMMLPMIHALGDDRALSYIKRLQTEFKTKTPILMWREQHSLIDGADPEDDAAPRNKIPTMPIDWRF